MKCKSKMHEIIHTDRVWLAIKTHKVIELELVTYALTKTISNIKSSQKPKNIITIIEMGDEPIVCFYIKIPLANRYFVTLSALSFRICFE